MERVAMFNKFAVIGEIVSSQGGTAFAPRAHDELNAMITMMADEWLVKKQKSKKFRITLRSIEKDAEGYIMITIMFVG
jgi:hypothetical protein